MDESGCYKKKVKENRSVENRVYVYDDVGGYSGDDLSETNKVNQCKMVFSIIVLWNHTSDEWKIFTIYAM